MEELKVLLDVTYIQLKSFLMCLGSEFGGFQNIGSAGMSLDYNQLKSLILRRISDHVAMDANSVLAELVADGIRIDVHAVRMALVRYHRLGLVKRERAGGMFRYSLSERGIARLRWLEQEKDKSE